MKKQTNRKLKQEIALPVDKIKEKIMGFADTRIILTVRDPGRGYKYFRHTVEVEKIGVMHWTKNGKGQLEVLCKLID